ncbi:hypothetical protein GCK32_017569 [Trichostrongylus colubriformis]|uniref:Uncharacterized protein n=1 Tax=Trichostrongylus colubriformis TaxID=6319 RepID=A0AAN8I9U3_TRICO
MIPILLPVKLFLQNLWRESLKWDNLLPEELNQKWYDISNSINCFTKMIDRRICETRERMKMFVFADASQNATAACVYLQDGRTTQLAMAKSKIPFLRSGITTPKHEMNALTLSLRLASFVSRSLPRSQLKEIFLFTDSKIVLRWLRTPPDKKVAGVLVSNRLKEIGRIVGELKECGTTCLFGHVSTSDNPADCASRGLTGPAFQDHFWWYGPKFIERDINEWLETVELFPIQLEEESHEEPLVVTLALSRAEESTDSILKLGRISSLHKAQRIVAYVIRFIAKTLRRFPRIRLEHLHVAIPALKVATNAGQLKGRELFEARKIIIRDHQRTAVTQHQLKSQ